VLVEYSFDAIDLRFLSLSEDFRYSKLYKSVPRFLYQLSAVS
jgi:hypothetical protein